MSGLRTSPYQFEVLVTYMEEHGDISKPHVNTKHKIEILRKWEELTEMLNSDVTSSAKTESKWKKVWTDLKNNTKKKLSRIEKDIESKGRTHVKFSDIELRVLDICGIKVESIDTSNISEDDAELNDDDSIVTERKNQRDSERIAMKRKMSQQSMAESDNDLNETADRTDHTYPSAKSKRLDLESIPDLTWRRFLAQKHMDELDLQRETNRIKQMEMQTQRGWQDIANRALNLIDKLVDKYCGDE